MQKIQVLANTREEAKDRVDEWFDAKEEEDKQFIFNIGDIVYRVRDTHVLVKLKITKRYVSRSNGRVKYSCLDLNKIGMYKDYEEGQYGEGLHSTKREAIEYRKELEKEKAEKTFKENYERLKNVIKRVEDLLPFSCYCPLCDIELGNTAAYKRAAQSSSLASDSYTCLICGETIPIKRG